MLSIIIMIMLSIIMISVVVVTVNILTKSAPNSYYRNMEYIVIIIL